SKGFIKEGPKNRLRAQDIHRIVDTFTRQLEQPRYSRMVPLAEIGDPKNDYNLNFARYIDSSEPEDIQDIDAHLRGGIPNRDLDALDKYWKVFPGVRDALFKKGDRPDYSGLKVPAVEIKATIFGHSEFKAWSAKTRKLFAKWRAEVSPRLYGIKKGDHPKSLIDAISEELLATFQKATLIDPYDVYQHLMDYWAETMQDDVYAIVAEGWREAAKPREILQVKGENGKLVWPGPGDFRIGKRRYKSDLLPAEVLVEQYFSAEAASVALDEYAEALDGLAATKAEHKAQQEALHAKVAAKYAQISEGDAKTLVVEHKWGASVDAAVVAELDRMSVQLAVRIHQLAERYASRLPAVERDANALGERVRAHLKAMGATWT
ncbi:type I restriction endonuclease subunit M, partial [bacterium]